MKAIGNIYLTWRKGKGSRRILVGIIKHNVTDGARFKYLSDGVEKAKAYGFSSYEGFPDITKEYTENVIDIFGQRIMRSERNDIDDFFSFWRLDKAYKEDNFYMLAYTQGLLPTDNFEFLAVFKAYKGLSFISEICGLSQYSIPTDLLSVGDRLRYVREPLNKFDEYAVKLYKGDTLLGYVKMVHCMVFRGSVSFKVNVHRIEKNGKLNRVFIHISV